MVSSVFRRVALDRLSSPEQLDQLVRVTSPQGWVALGIFSGLLAIALIWGSLGSVSMELTADGILQLRKGERSAGLRDEIGELEAVLSLPANMGRQLCVGMEVHIFPEDVPERESGFLIGNISALHFTQKGASPWTEVEVVLERDPTVPTRYRWFSLRRLGGDLSSGAPITGKIVVRTHPLNLLIPGLRRPGGT